MIWDSNKVIIIIIIIIPYSILCKQRAKIAFILHFSTTENWKTERLIFQVLEMLNVIKGLQV